MTLSGEPESAFSAGASSDTTSWDTPKQKLATLVLHQAWLSSFKHFGHPWRQPGSGRKGSLERARMTARPAILKTRARADHVSPHAHVKPIEEAVREALELILGWFLR